MTHDTAATWDFATAARILFGPGTRHQLPPAIAALGRRPLLVTGRHAARGSVGSDGAGADGTGGSGEGGRDGERPPALPDIDAAGRFVVEGEPTIETVRAGVETFREASCDLVIGVGGGSALDAAKAIAALAANRGDPLDYLEVIGRGRPLEQTPVPCVAVPTTAGTGSEVTRNAVLGSAAHRRKASLRHPAMLPRLAVVDPELTLTLPPAVTASTGLDALTQLIEPYVSPRATPFTDLLCLDGIRRVSRSLRIAASPAGGTSLDARTDMSFASLLGGLALANAGLGVVHGFAAPIGGMFPAPHGAVCAALLPHGMAANLRALRERAPGHPAIERYGHVAAALTGDPSAPPEAGIDAVAALCADLGIRGLRAYGLGEADVPAICVEARQASSMKANPIVLDDEELQAALLAAL